MRQAAAASACSRKAAVRGLRPHSRRRRLLTAGLLALGLAAAGATGAAGQGVVAVGAQLSISPTRLTFGEAPSVAQVTVATPGQEQIYEVNLVDRVMTSDGRILEAGDPALGAAAGVFDRSAKGRVTVSPEQIRVAPGRPASITVRSTGRVGPLAGEYRTHLTLRPVTPPGGTTAQGAQVVFVFSIPIIVRVGPVDARAAIEQVQLSRIEAPGGSKALLQTAPAVTLQLVRLGQNSVYGDIEVRSAADPEGPLLAELRGVAAYPEVGRRLVRIPLRRELVPGERVQIRFIDRDLRPGRLLAQVELSLGAARHAQLLEVPPVLSP